MNTDKKIFINTFYQMIGKVSTSLFGVISFAFLARYLQDQLGEYVLISSFVGFIIVFADLGLGTLLTREIASKRADDKYISFVFTIRLLLTILAAILGSMLIFLFPYSITVKIGVVILSLANILYLLAATIWAIFQAELHFEKVVYAQVVSSCATCILIVLAVFLRLPLLFFILASSIGLILCFTMTYFQYVGIIHLRINIKAFLKILKETWPLGAGVIVSVLYFKIDSLILPYFYNPSVHPDLAYYSTAYKIFEVAIVFGGYYTATLFPVFSANLHSKSFMKHFNKHLLYSVMLAVSATITLFICAKIFILILAGNSFLSAVPSLQILSIAALASILSGFFINIGVAGGKQLLILKFSIIIAIINIALNLLIIPKYSFIGASWTTVITQMFILIANIYTAILVIKERRATIGA